MSSHSNPASPRDSLPHSPRNFASDSHSARNTAFNQRPRRKRSYLLATNSLFETVSFANILFICATLLVSTTSLAYANHDAPSHHNHHQHRHNHHHNHDKSNKDAKPEAPPRVSLGIADASAIAGRLFEYSIPPHAFSGDVSSFTASEAGLAQLPKWMGFKSETGLFFGVPDESDVGQTFISVMALGADDDIEDAASISGAKDVFSISVVSKAPRVTASPYALKNGDFEKRECAPEEPSTISSVIVDRIFAEMVVEEKIQLLEKFAEFVQVRPFVCMLHSLR